jgi:alpha/beta superfamily hydrolase
MFFQFLLAANLVIFSFGAKVALLLVHDRPKAERLKKILKAKGGDDSSPRRLQISNFAYPAPAATAERMRSNQVKPGQAW